MSVIKLNIDEERKFCLTKYATKTGKPSIKESDHNTLILELNLKQSLNNNKEKRQTVFNFNNKDNFQKFIKNTTANTLLEDCFDDDKLSIEILSRKWLKII